jgi:hypothetical protein
MIEPCWAYLKRKTTRKGALTSRAHAKQQWLNAWEELPQWRIQAWIERIPRYIQEVIKDKGGNDYREGAAERRRTQRELEVAGRRKQPYIDAMYKQLRQKLFQQDLPAQYMNLFSPPKQGIAEWVDDNEWQRLEDEATNRRKAKIRHRKRLTFTLTEAQSAIVDEVVQ